MIYEKVTKKVTNLLQKHIALLKIGWYTIIILEHEGFVGWKISWLDTEKTLVKQENYLYNTGVVLI